MSHTPALIFSLAWAASRRAATSFIGFHISEPRAVAAAPGPPPPLRVKERGGGRGVSPGSVRPRFTLSSAC